MPRIPLENHPKNPRFIGTWKKPEGLPIRAEAYHSKGDILVIPEAQLLRKSIDFLFKISVLSYSTRFPHCLSHRRQPGMDTGKCHVLTKILRNNTTIFTKSGLAWFYVIDACNPSASASDSTGHSLQARGHPCRGSGSPRAVRVPVYLAVFARFS